MPLPSSGTMLLRMQLRRRQDAQAAARRSLRVRWSLWYGEPWYLLCNPWSLTGLADLFGSAGPRPVWEESRPLNPRSQAGTAKEPLT